MIRLLDGEPLDGRSMDGVLAVVLLAVGLLAGYAVGVVVPSLAALQALGGYGGVLMLAGASAAVGFAAGAVASRGRGRRQPELPRGLTPLPPKAAAEILEYAARRAGMRR